ncbi:hypothetical protein GTW67_10100, partial [Streptomyces sp. SID5910]|nr:hypothetical protein [Streptomyces sp. SID5910]
MPARRKFPVLALAVMAAGLALTACDNGGTTDGAAPSTATATVTAGVAQSPTAEKPDAPTGQSGAAPSGTPAQDGRKCTDQQDYAGDPRSNAEINS